MTRASHETLVEIRGRAVQALLPNNLGKANLHTGGTVEDYSTVGDGRVTKFVTDTVPPKLVVLHEIKDGSGPSSPILGAIHKAIDYKFGVRPRFDAGAPMTEEEAAGVLNSLPEPAESF